MFVLASTFGVSLKGKQSTRIRSSSGSNGYFSEQRCEASHCGRAKTKGSKGTKGLSGVCRSLWISNSSFVGPIFNGYSSVGYSLLIKKEKAIKVQPNRATIGNGPSFGWVFMADFLTALAKKVKTNTATVENYRCIYVPPGIPLRREKDEPLRVNVIFKYEFQMQYGSIGWSVGATLGYAQAATDKHVISCIGDGTFQ
ncbi:Pyruvate decarboxylase 1, partial [Glycine soja]